ncbi:MAG: deoxyribose-phosphate aldolase [Gemmatimonadaceae bacterium]
MSVDLNALALQIASELAKGDLARTTPGAAPQGRPGGLPTPPRGVTFAAGPARLADFVDHTLLRAEAGRREVEALCVEAAEHRFAAVCVLPLWVPLCRALLAGSAVRVATVIGYPTGASRVEVKALEARLAADDGADELDVVAPISQIRAGEWRYVAADVAAAVGAVPGRIVKIVLETAAMTPVEIVRAAGIARDEGAHYVKTSTGAHPAGGATPEAVALLRLAVGDALGVKASGGIRDASTALAMIAAGATRVGTSHGVAMAAATGAGPLPVAELFGAPSASGGPTARTTTPADSPAAGTPAAGVPSWGGAPFGTPGRGGPVAPHGT